jgi:ribosomal-protein-alanine N-acetyltransferase
VLGRGRMDIKIEPAALALLDKLCEIETASFREEAFTRSQIASLLTGCNDLAFVAQIGGETAGFVIGTVEIAGKRTFGHILTIDVLPRYRRIGIARRLLHTVEAAFRENDIPECRLEVREDNSVALSLYLKLGYQKVGRLEKYYGKKHGLYLRKTL